MNYVNKMNRVDDSSQQKDIVLKQKKIVCEYAYDSFVVSHTRCGYVKSLLFL